MGRRKIEIKAIKDDRNRSVTFLKRKGGLFKKAHELSVLCSVDVAVFVFGNNKKLYEYSSIDMRELIARYQYHGGPSEHKGPSDFNGGAQDDDDDDDGDGTPPRGLNGMEAHMMPPHFQGQPQPPPPPPPFSQPRHHTASASPPISNGPFTGRQPHVQRGHTPQPSITHTSTSRPGSRGDMRHMSMGPGMAAAARQPAGPHHHAPHPGMAYMAAPPPVYTQAGGLMPPGPAYSSYQPQQPPQQQQQQQPYMEERRPSGPSGFATQQPPSAQGVPSIAQTRPSPPQPHPQSLHHQPPPNHIHHSSPQPERRHLDPQHPPPHVDLRPGSSDLTKQPFGSTDMGVKRLPQRKSHSIFTPIEENRSILSLHLASFAPEPPIKVEQVTVEPVKTDAGTPAVIPAPGLGHRSSSADSGPSGRSAAKKASPLLAQRSSDRNSSISSAAETTASPPAQSGSLKVGVPGGSRARGPRLTVQIPDGSSEVESATGGSISPRNIVESPAQAPQRHNSTAVVLPPPSPSAQTLLSAGAIGPPNPFARPPPQQNINGETPVSALPSRFLNTELLPSPNSFYTEWNFRGGDSNTLPSPLNFTTPVVGTGPSFLRDDAHSSSNGAATTSALLPSAATTTTSAAPSAAATATMTASSIAGGLSSSVSVPTITTTAASESMPPAPSGLGKRKSPDFEGEGEPSRDAPETRSDPKRLRVS